MKIKFYYQQKLQSYLPNKLCWDKKRFIVQFLGQLSAKWLTVNIYIYIVTHLNPPTRAYMLWYEKVCFIFKIMIIVIIIIIIIIIRFSLIGLPNHNEDDANRAKEQIFYSVAVRKMGLMHFSISVIPNKQSGHEKKSPAGLVITRAYHTRGSLLHFKIVIRIN